MTIFTRDKTGSLFFNSLKCSVQTFDFFLSGITFVEENIYSRIFFSLLAEPLHCKQRVITEITMLITGFYGNDRN